MQAGDTASTAPTATRRASGSYQEKNEEYFPRNLVLAVVWFLWLLIGSCFYMEVLDLNFPTGFYMAVNIGYSIGWGDISEEGELGSQWFSTVYVLIGASFVGAGLGIFAEYIVANKENWYEKEKENLRYQQETADAHILYKAWQFYLLHRIKFRSIILWVVFVIIATFSAWATNDEFNFTNSLYFAVSSLSTGGHYSLPADNREWVYGLTGLYCAFGVPLMGIAMATLASFFIDVGSIEEALHEIKAPVSEVEIDMLTEFGLADEDGEIDRCEFIVLCMVRIGAASPELIKLIEDYFDELDADKNGKLSIEEILKSRDRADAAVNMLLHKVTTRMKGGRKAVINALKDQKEKIKQVSFKQTKNASERLYSSLTTTLSKNSDMESSDITGVNPMKQLEGNDQI